jgi:hypothetical protein
MQLAEKEIDLFYKVWFFLTWALNEKHNLVEKFPKPVWKKTEPPNIIKIMTIRSTVWKKPELIDELLNDTNYDYLFNANERDVVIGWRNHFVKSNFFVIKHMKKYSVFLQSGEPAKLYGVTGISDPIEHLYPFRLPYIAQATLLPLKDKIIYDGIINVSQITFGSGITKSLNQEYKTLKERYGIIEQLTDEKPKVNP